MFCITQYRYAHLVNMEHGVRHFSLIDHLGAYSSQIMENLYTDKQFMFQKSLALFQWH